MAIDPISLGIGGVQTIGKLGLAAFQAYKASKVKLQDTTTPEQREMLATARQRAASLNMPGQAFAQNRLAQAQNAAVRGATLGSGGASDYLASVSAADNSRQNGELQLSDQRQRYLQQAQGGLQQQLSLQAQQRQKDLATYNNTKAELTGSAIKNASNALDAGSAYAAYGLSRDAPATGFGEGAVDPLTPRAIGLQMGGPAAYAPGIRGTGLPGYLPSLNGGRYASSRNRYGLPF